MCMVGAAEGQKRASYFLENELWVVMRQDESVENEISIFFKSKCSPTPVNIFIMSLILFTHYTLSHFLSTFVFPFPNKFPFYFYSFFVLLLLHEV